MATVTDKRMVLSTEGKDKIIRETENGKKKANICREFGLVNSTAPTTWKDGTKPFEQNESRTMRLRKPEKHDVDETLLKWFTYG
jgi:transposase-like protein